MEEKVKAFIEAGRQALEQEAGEKRAEKLVSLGLYTEERVYAEGKYTHMTPQFPFYDVDKDDYYSVKRNPLPVTDEEYAEICRLCPEPRTETEGKAEGALRAWATVLIVIGVLDVLFGLGYGFFSEEWGYAGGGLAGLFICFVAAAVLRVLANISDSLTGISEKIDQGTQKK